MTQISTIARAIPSATFTFDPERIYEITGIWVRPGQGEAMDAYFGEVFPIAAKDYGVRPLFSLEPVNVHAGDFRPDRMFVNEWPSLEAFQSFASDERATRLFPRRDAAASRLVVTQYRVGAPASVELHENDVIEIGAMWIRPGQQEALQSYYSSVVPVALRHGMRPITRMTPAFSYRGHFEPSVAGLNWWGTLEAFKAFEREVTPRFAERNATLSRLEVTHARVHLAGER